MNKALLLIADIDEFIPFEEFMLGKGGVSSLCGKYKTVSGELSGWAVTAVHSRIGKVNTATAAAYFIALEKPDAVLNFGLAGAVSKVLRGDIVAGTSFCECDFDLRAAGLPLGKKPQQEQSTYTPDAALLEAAKKIEGVKTGAFGTGDMFLTDSKKCAQYKREFGICAFDMESAAAASVCFELSVPFLSFKKISDNADDAAISEYREMNTARQQQLGDIAQQILRNAAENM
ncbi:MAG: 5'-methylthioadenosine/S-adenosylhomocysteine nucleosidase [Clostridiales bacterium]|nr:5'-methylthioadenosine/S-adenosylhomocysteine nucleosidase [Clostridiales bacterium]